MCNPQHYNSRFPRDTSERLNSRLFIANNDTTPSPYETDTRFGTHFKPTEINKNVVKITEGLTNVNLTTVGQELGDNTYMTLYTTLDGDGEFKQTQTATSLEKYQVRKSKSYFRHNNWYRHFDPPPP